MTIEYLVVLPVEEIPEGASYKPGQPLPLHCTLMQWFHPGENFGLVGLGNELMLLAWGVKEGFIELVSKEPALFGPKGDVPVHVMERNENLNLLHTELFVFLAKTGSLPKELGWVGAGYRPHVTTALGEAFPPGKRHRAEWVVLIERNERKIRKVLGIYGLGEVPF